MLSLTLPGSTPDLRDLVDNTSKGQPSNCSKNCALWKETSLILRACRKYTIPAKTLTVKVALNVAVKVVLKVALKVAVKVAVKVALKVALKVAVKVALKEAVK